MEGALGGSPRYADLRSGSLDRVGKIQVSVVFKRSTTLLRVKLDPRRIVITSIAAVLLAAIYVSFAKSAGERLADPNLVEQFVPGELWARRIKAVSPHWILRSRALPGTLCLGWSRFLGIG